MVMHIPGRTTWSIDPDSDSDPDPDPHFYWPLSSSYSYSYSYSYSCSRICSPRVFKLRHTVYAHAAKSGATRQPSNFHSHPRVRERVPLRCVRVRFRAQLLG
ncbi:MAG: hypothetical protein ACOX52_20960 [Verrucomicrobiota bacterium]